MRKIYIILASLHLFVGIGAIFGGLGVIINPTGESFGITTDILKRGPFTDFLIPGLILFTFIGIMDIVVGVFALKNYKYQAYLSGVMGVGLMVFITVQCIILNDIIYLHIIFFILGLIECIFASLLAIKKKNFPINLFIKK